MNKHKIPVKKRKSATSELEKFRFEDSFNPHKFLRIIFYLLVLIIPAGLSAYYLRNALALNQFLSFPLDDPWIHLTFAKNLVQYFSFSYFKNEMVTAGSTSPLYTILVAIAFLFSNNEMLISYALGVLFFSLAALSFYLLSVFEFDKDYLFALICTGLFIIDKWMVFISVSGMETTMFIFILVLCSYFYKTRKAVPFAVMLGLIIWTRPDGVAFIIAAIIDYILIVLYSRSQTGLILFSAKDLKKIALIFIGIVGLYFVMNLLLSGSLLPNTYNAKLTYYSPEFRSRGDFLEYEVWDYFRSGSYALVVFGFIFSVLKLFYDLKKNSYNPNTLYILFIFGLIFIYWLKLPYAHRFGRYMMPIIPFFLLVAVIGFRDFARLVNKFTQNPLFSKIVFYALVGFTFILATKSFDENKDLYTYHSKYIYDRQVVAAKWLNQNTDEKDIIATHDVGAIGYYSGRKIVDVAGLVTPELINKINDENYVDFMTKYLKENNVTYLAFLREWYRVTNQTPLLLTPNTYSPEIMEVFKFDPNKTHILSREANGLLMNAQSLIGQKAGPQLMFIANRMIALEPKSAYGYYIKALAHFYLKEDNKYESSLLKAIEIFPAYDDANFSLADYYKSQKRFDDAKNQYEKILEMNPKNLRATNSLKALNIQIEKNKSLPKN